MNTLLERTPRELASLKRLVQGSVAYSAVTIAQRSIMFLMLPAYARILEPSDFGQIAIVAMIASVASTALAFGAEAAVFRNYFQLENRPEERRRYISSIGLFLMTVPLLVVVLILLATQPLLRRWDSVQPSLVTLGVIAAAIDIFAQSVVFALLRAEERFREFLGLSAISLGFLTGGTFLLVFYFDLGVRGWFLAQLLSATITFGVGLAVFRHFWSPRVSMRYVAAALAFGLPIVPHQLAHWGLALADRAVLSAWVSNAQLGIYSLGYQIAAALGIVLTALNRSVMPEYGRASADERQLSRLSIVVLIQALSTMFLGVGMALMGPIAVQMFLPAEYSQAGELIPWVALGYTMYGLYFIPMNALTIVRGDTRWNWVFTLLAVGVNIGLNIWLVPKHGIMVPAIATAVGYGCLFILITIYATWKHGRIVPYQLAPIATGAAVMLAVFGLAVITSPSGVISGSVVRAGWLLIALVLLASICLGSRRRSQVPAFALPISRSADS